MKILYITTEDPKSQGDYMEVSMLHGLRSVLGNDCFDYPRKQIMYGDFSESPKNELHGWGFSLLTKPINDIDNRFDKVLNGLGDILNSEFVVLYGVVEAYGMKHDRSFEKHPNCKGVFYLDGHDHERITRKPCFKRELFKAEENVWATGFGIPEHRIREIHPSRFCEQWCQKTAPPYALFGPQILGPDARQLYRFTNEEEYYDDMASSFVGLTCKKGGWDSLRHYEIMAAGTLLLFRDYDQKPPLCSPQNLPTISYSSPEELEKIINRLYTVDSPTQEYIDLLYAQREWLVQNGTTVARARKLLNTVAENV